MTENSLTTGGPCWPKPVIPISSVKPRRLSCKCSWKPMLRARLARAATNAPASVSPIATATATAAWIPAWANSTCVSPNCARAATSLPSWRPQDQRESPCGRDPGGMGSAASPPAVWRIWCRLWASRASAKAPSASSAATSMSACTPSSTGRSPANGPISGSTPPTSSSVRAGGIVSVAAIIAVAANTDGKREIVGLHIGPSEAEAFWGEFLGSLHRRGLRGTRLIISDAHEGLKAAIRRVFAASWQRCRVHWMRNALAYVHKSPNQHGCGRPASGLHPAGSQGRAKRCAMLLISYGRNSPNSPPSLRQAKPMCCLIWTSRPSTVPRSTRPTDRAPEQRGQTKGRRGRHLSNEASIIRLIGAVLLEQNDEWQLQHRYMQVEAMAEIAAPPIDADKNTVPTLAA